MLELGYFRSHSVYLTYSCQRTHTYAHYCVHTIEMAKANIIFFNIFVYPYRKVFFVCEQVCVRIRFPVYLRYSLTLFTWQLRRISLFALSTIRTFHYWYFPHLIQFIFIVRHAYFQYLLAGRH